MQWAFQFLWKPKKVVQWAFQFLGKPKEFVQWVVSFSWEAKGGGGVEGSSFLAEAGVVSFFRVVLLADFCAFFARKRIRASFSLLHSIISAIGLFLANGFFLHPYLQVFFEQYALMG